MWCGEPMGAVHIHHINHDHTDDRIRNCSLICEKCHRVHHSENGVGMMGKYGNSETPIPAADFPKTLKAYRKARGWSARAGAARMGISTSSLIRYETGEVQPTLRVLTTIAEVLGITVDTLVGRRLGAT
jgi:ribosome-binding protein aMBF1 (putative translation factor)